MKLDHQIQRQISYCRPSVELDDLASGDGLEAPPSEGENENEAALTGRGRKLYQDYVKLYVPERGVDRLDKLEFEMASAVVELNVAKLFGTVGAIIGFDSLESRLKDLKKYYPFGQGCIPIVYVPKPEHPHNILVGIPYTGVFLGRWPDSGSVAAHEMAHMIFGKFNNGLTEPLANLFVDRSQQDSVKSGPPRGSQGSRSEGKESEKDAQLRLRPPELVTLAVLELFEEGTRLANFSRLGDLFSYHPMYRLVAHERYKFQRQSGCEPMQAAKETQAFLQRLLTLNYYQDFLAYPSLGLEESVPADAYEIERWEERHTMAAVEAHRRNPNETSGLVRDLQGHLDNTLMAYLLRKGLPDGQAPHDCAATGARQSIHRLLHFYYAPQATLSAYGWATFDAMQEEMKKDLHEQYHSYLHDSPGSFAWYQLMEDLRTSPCYQPESWGTDECRAPRDERDPIQRFIRTLPEERAGKGMRRALHPVVKKARSEPVTDSDGFSLVDRLGHDLDFKTYFALP